MNRSLTLPLTLALLAATPWVSAQETPPVPISRTKPDGTPNRAAWMAEGSFRFFIDGNGVMQKQGNNEPPRYHMPTSQFIGNVQWHCLLPQDLTFNPAIPSRLCRYSDAELFGFGKEVKSVGGAITINVPLDVANGRIAEDSHAQLVRLSNALGPRK